MEFLFGSDKTSSDEITLLKNKIEILQNQMLFFQERLLYLEEHTSSGIPDKIVFKDVKDFSDDELLLIIRYGFFLNKIYQMSLKDYFEGEGEMTLSELRHFKIKYASINKLAPYRNFKDDFLGKR